MRALFCLLFLFCLIACQKSIPSEKNSARFNLSTEPVSLDPRKARDLTSSSLIRMIFEGLTRVGRDGKWELALAERVDISDDGLRYIFFLRDTKWSNGDRLIADDFAQSWKTILDPHFPSDIAHQLFSIKNARQIKKGALPIEKLGIEVIDDRTLAIELEEPVPYFLELVSMPAFFAVHQNPAVSNGPFLLQSWKIADSLVFIKNRAYWEEKLVNLDQLEAVITSSDTGLKMFREKKLDWIGSPLSTIPSDAIGELKAKGALQTSPFCGTFFFRVNVNCFPYSNLFFRKALLTAMKRELITEHLLQGGQKPAKALVPLEMGLSKEGYFSDKENTAQNWFEQAMKETGLNRSEFPAVVLSFMNGDKNLALAQAIQKQWEDTLGIRVELDPVEPKVYFQRVSRKEFVLALGSWTADFNDPINFLEVFKYKESGTNNTGWENQRFIDLLTQSSVCRKTEERIACLKEAEAILMDQAPIIPIYHLVLNYLVQDKLKGVVLSPIGGIDFRWAYWEK